MQATLLANGLARAGLAVTVITFYPGGPLRGRLVPEVTVRSLDKRSRWDVWGFLRCLFRVLDEAQPDVLYAFLTVPNLLACLARQRSPGLKVVWGVRASELDLARYDWLSRFTYWLECRLSRCPNLIIANSVAGRRHAVLQGFPDDERFIVIPNGIDVERFHPDSGLREAVRAEWGVLPHEVLVGIVARLDPMKGHETFLKAAAILTGERQGVRFICVGDGPEAFKQKLVALSKEVGLGHRLIWVSAGDNVGAIYNALDLVTSCSSYGEGFSNVIGEAMACGRPCVVTDVGDAKRIVGDTGYVVAPENPAALASAWQVALDAGDDEKARRGQRAREHIIEHFSLERLIEDTARVLETTVKMGAQRTIRV